MGHQLAKIEEDKSTKNSLHYSRALANGVRSDASQCKCNKHELS